MSSTLITHISSGIWYRRLDRQMYAASLRDDRVHVSRLDPNTLEPLIGHEAFEIESFFSFFCRSEKLGVRA